jgi:hypothetical protein
MTVAACGLDGDEDERRLAGWMRAAAIGELESRLRQTPGRQA